MFLKSNKRRIDLLIVILILFSAGIIQVPAENKYKWQRFGGKWVIANSLLEEKQVWASPWYYYELLNYNTLISFNKIENYNTFKYTFKVLKPGIEIKTRDKEPAFMTAFNVKSPYRSWYFHMFAVKITGNSDYLDKISLIFSDRIDKTKKYAVKHNTFVKELSSEKIKLDYGKEYTLNIDLSGNNALVTIDGKKVLEGQMPESDHGGKFALSSKNLQLKVKDFTVLHKNDVVFSDDFSHDTIFVLKMRAKKNRK